MCLGLAKYGLRSLRRTASKSVHCRPRLEHAFEWGVCMYSTKFIRLGKHINTVLFPLFLSFLLSFSSLQDIFIPHLYLYYLANNLLHIITMDFLRNAAEQAGEKYAAQQFWVTWVTTTPAQTPTTMTILTTTTTTTIVTQTIMSPLLTPTLDPTPIPTLPTSLTTLTLVFLTLRRSLTFRLMLPAIRRWPAMLEMRSTNTPTRAATAITTKFGVLHTDIHAL